MMLATRTARMLSYRGRALVSSPLPSQMNNQQAYRPMIHRQSSQSVRGFASAPAPPPPSDDSPPEATEDDDLTQAKAETPTDAPENELKQNLRPSQVVDELNQHIVGQPDAKKAVAIAMRNRWRRRQLPDHLRKEVTPRNVLLVGPTGCGKTGTFLRFSFYSPLCPRYY